MKYRAIVFIAIAVPLSAIIFFAVQSRFREDVKPAEENAQQAETVEPQVTQISSDAVASPILSFGGDAVWFMTRNGKMFRQALGSGDRQETEMPSTLQNVMRIIWQRNDSSFIVEQNFVGHVRYQFYNADTKTFLSYAPEVRQPVFTFDDKKIVYDWTTAQGLHELTMADGNGQNYQKVADLPRADFLVVASPTKPEVAVFSDNTVDPGELWLVDLVTGMHRVVGKNFAYEGGKFSPDGTKFLVSRRDGAGAPPALVVYDLVSNAETIVGLAGEIGQTAWLSDSGAILVASGDGLVKHTLADGKRELIYKENNFSARELLANPKDSSVIFTKPETGQLYRLSF